MDIDRHHFRIRQGGLNEGSVVLLLFVIVLYCGVLFMWERGENCVEACVENVQQYTCDFSHLLCPFIFDACVSE